MTSLTESQQAKLRELLTAYADSDAARKRIHAAEYALRDMLPNGGFRHCVIDGVYLKFYRSSECGSQIKLEEMQKVEEPAPTGNKENT